MRSPSVFPQKFSIVTIVSLTSLVIVLHAVAQFILTSVSSEFQCILTLRRHWNISLSIPLAIILDLIDLQCHYWSYDLWKIFIPSESILLHTSCEWTIWYRYLLRNIIYAIVSKHWDEISIYFWHMQRGC